MGAGAGGVELVTSVDMNAYASLSELKTENCIVIFCQNESGAIPLFLQFNEFV